MSTDTSCFIWGLPDICRECKHALVAGETENLNPARCWPRPTPPAVDEAERRLAIRRALRTAGYNSLWRKLG